MFTGIVEEVGRIKSMRSQGQSAVLEIEGSREGSVIFDDIKLGDSVAVNGICLTVTSFGRSSFTADVMHETLNRSSIGKIGVGGKVNLERAMPACGRFGGHIVSGHIDGVGKVEQIERDSNAVWYRISAPAEIMRYVVEKGSIAIDGISLTVAKLSATWFEVSIIPHTLEQTVLGDKRVGDIVNLENDVVAKYVEKLMQLGVGCSAGNVGDGEGEGDTGAGAGAGIGGAGAAAGATASPQGTLTEAFLAQNGFL